MPDPKREARSREQSEELPEKTAEVAAVIAEVGLRYASDATPGYKRSGTSFGITTMMARGLPTKDSPAPRQKA